MLILTEKPSVAKDFGQALDCHKSNGFYYNEKNQITIVNCIGHLFSLYSPQDYDEKYKDWKTLPIIPIQFKYNISSNVLVQAKLVCKLLREHKNDLIIIATDADREGEIIARECLLNAGLIDFNNIRRFWVSQALTKEVILEGLKNTKPLSDYDLLAQQGFQRQHADWLVGINFTRYITAAANKLLPVGRVQTSILSAIETRCNAIKNFQSTQYFEYYGLFEDSITKTSIKGIYLDKENNTKFSDKELIKSINNLIGLKGILISQKKNEKSSQAPQLYNLNALQKEAFRSYGYTAEETLNIVQELYEKLKCVSYPRTPSRVMGERNVALCESIYTQLINIYPEYKTTVKNVDISLKNKRCFNDKKLEAHHALIPLKPIEENATLEEKNIYKLILERFMVAFLPDEKYEQLEYILSVHDYNFKITGKKIIEYGWRNPIYKWTTIKNEHVEENQDLTKVDFNNMTLDNIEMKEKWTNPPKYFNEASILSFMENPKNTDTDEKQKLIGLGTPATRHTFIPKLLKAGYIKLNNKNILCTELGSEFLNVIKSSSIKSIADIEQTTIWEEKLANEPYSFFKEISDYVVKAVMKKLNVDTSNFNTPLLICPICHKEIRKGKNNWYCTGYKEGCNFPTIWQNVANTKLNQTDVQKLLNGKQTGIKHCKSKQGKSFNCKFLLDDNYNIKMIFEN